jgi:eukaryotic-like serine/threonine-protein kinase
MAEVWEGRDEVLNRPIAIKVLSSHLAADPLVRERFRREAITAARLVHPGIVAIFDAGVDVLVEGDAAAGPSLAGDWLRDETERLGAWPEGPSTAYIVMELVPGQTLRDLMVRGGQLPAGLSIAIVAQLADALAYAHAQGLVHRDIKPANILLRDEGDDMFRVKIADFGIAKAVAAAGAELTAKGDMLGTPKYLSPEQVQGLEPDGRADLYSVGVVLYEMLAGRPPFSGSNEMATALAHVEQPVPDIDDARHGLPSGLGELVSSLLVKDPRYRLPSALALCGAITSVRKGMGTPGYNDPGAYLSFGAVARNGGVAGGQDDRPEAVRRAGNAEASAETLVGPASPEERANGIEGGGDETTVGQERTVSFESPIGPGTAPATPRGRKARKAQRAQSGRRRKSWRATNIVVGSLLVAGLLVAAALVRADRPPSKAPGGTPTTVPGRSAASAVPGSTVQVVGVHELTQDGNLPNDDLGQLGNVIDGKASSFWESDVYKGPEFGGSGGFGLVLELRAARSLHSLVVTTPMRDWTAEVFTADSDSGDLSGWGRPVEKRTGITGNETFSLAGRKASWVLFWMIDPGPSRQAVVDELSVT